MINLVGGVAALHGKETGAGDFLVLDILEAGLAPQIELPLKSSMFATAFLFLPDVGQFFVGSNIFFFKTLSNLGIHHIY